MARPKKTEAEKAATLAAKNERRRLARAASKPEPKPAPEVKKSAPKVEPETRTTPENTTLATAHDCRSMIVEWGEFINETVFAPESERLGLSGLPALALAADDGALTSYGSRLLMALNAQMAAADALSVVEVEASAIRAEREEIDTRRIEYRAQLSAALDSIASGKSSLSDHPDCGAIPLLLERMDANVAEIDSRINALQISSLQNASNEAINATTRLQHDLVVECRLSRANALERAALAVLRTQADADEKRNVFNTQYKPSRLWGHLLSMSGAVECLRASRSVPYANE